MATKKYWDILTLNEKLLFDTDEVLVDTHSSGRGLQIKDVADPTDDQDAATKKYVDANGGGGGTAPVRITLPDGDSVAARIAGATEGVDYPMGWALMAGTSPVDLDIVHNLGTRLFDVKVYANFVGDEEQQLVDSAAHNGLISVSESQIRIVSLATVRAPIRLHIIFI